MNESHCKPVGDNSKRLTLEKRGDILQATFEHYYRMAMDHHTKAATTSNILLVIVGAILALAGFDEAICRSFVDIGSAIIVILIGLFGAVWAWKQHERYHYWEFIARKYQDELRNIVPDFKTEPDYENGARAHTTKLFGPIFAKTLQDRYLWVFLHIVVVVIGIVLLTLSLWETCAPSGA